MKNVFIVTYEDSTADSVAYTNKSALLRRLHEICDAYNNAEYERNRDNALHFFVDEEKLCVFHDEPKDDGKGFDRIINPWVLTFELDEDE